MSTLLRKATAYSLQDDIMNLLKKDYFYGHVVLQLRREERRDLDTTMAVGIQGGLTLYYNPAHLIKYEAPQRLADLKHEVLHILNRHFARRTDLRNNQTILKITTPLLMAEVQKIPDDCFKRLYNYAADMAINQYIADISEDSLFPSDFKLPDGLSTEEYFVSLVENLIKDSKQHSYHQTVQTTTLPIKVLEGLDSPPVSSLFQKDQVTVAIVLNAVPDVPCHPVFAVTPTESKENG